MLVRVLAAVLGDAHAAEGAEDGVGAVVLVEVVRVLCELAAVAVEGGLCGGELGAGVGDARGFRGRGGGGVGEDAVFDEGDAEGAQFVVDPGA